MKLFYTTSSPYARKTRIVAIETGVAEQLELVLVTVRDPNSKLLRYSPVGKVPVIETDDSQILCEASMICDYFDSLHDGPHLVPPEGAARWEVLRQEGLAAGLLEGVVTWVRETRRPKPKHSAEVLGLETERTARCLDTFEAEAAAGRLDRPLNIAQVTLGCVLGQLDFRLAAYDWRAACPKLGAWFAAFSARPSMTTTAPRDS